MTNFETNIAAALKDIIVGKQNCLNEDMRYAAMSRGFIATKTIRFGEATKMKPRDPRRFISVTPKGREFLKAVAA